MKRFYSVLSAVLIAGVQSAIADPTNTPSVSNRTVMADAAGAVVSPTNYWEANSNSISTKLGISQLIADVLSNSATVSGLPTSHVALVTFNAATVAQWAAINTAQSWANSNAAQLAGLPTSHISRSEANGWSNAVIAKFTAIDANSNGVADSVDTVPVHNQAWSTITDKPSVLVNGGSDYTARFSQVRGPNPSVSNDLATKDYVDSQSGGSNWVGSLNGRITITNNPTSLGQILIVNPTNSTAYWAFPTNLSYTAVATNVPLAAVLAANNDAAGHFMFGFSSIQSETMNFAHVISGVDWHWNWISNAFFQGDGGAVSNVNAFRFQGYFPTTMPVSVAQRAAFVEQGDDVTGILVMKTTNSLILENGLIFSNRFINRWWSFNYAASVTSLFVTRDDGVTEKYFHDQKRIETTNGADIGYLFVNRMSSDVDVVNHAFSNGFFSGDGTGVSNVNARLLNGQPATNLPVSGPQRTALVQQNGSVTSDVRWVSPWRPVLENGLLFTNASPAHSWAFNYSLLATGLYVLRDGSVFEYYHHDKKRIINTNGADIGKSLNVGQSNTVSGTNNLVSGRFNQLVGNDLFAVGNANSVSGSLATAIGNLNIVKSTGGVAIGLQAVVTNDNSMVMSDGSTGQVASTRNNQLLASFSNGIDFVTGGTNPVTVNGSPVLTVATAPGGGDMLRSTYDANSNGTVDAVDANSINSNNIANGGVAMADIGQGGATNGQAIVWSSATTSWGPSTISGSGGSSTNVTAANVIANGGGGTNSGQLALGDHNHDAMYVNEAQTNSVTTDMVTDGTLGSVDMSAGALTLFTNDAKAIVVAGTGSVSVSSSTTNNQTTYTVNGPGPAGGGSSGNATSIQGFAVSTNPPSNNQVLKYSTSAQAYVASADEISGIATSDFANGITIGSSRWVINETSDGPGDNNLHIFPEHGDNSDMEFRAAPDSDTSNKLQMNVYLNLSGNTNNHLGYGIGGARGNSGYTNGTYIGTVQVGTATVMNLYVLIDNGGQDMPVCVAMFSTNGNIGTQGGLLVSSNEGLNIVGTYNALFAPTKTITDPEITMLVQAAGFAKGCSFRSSATTVGSQNELGSVGFFSRGYGSPYTNMLLFQTQDSGAVAIRQGPSSGNYPIRAIWNSEGLMGLNWTNPTERLTVNGNILAYGNIVASGGYFGSNTVGVGAYTLSDNGTGLVWRSTDAAPIPGNVTIEEPGKITRYNEYEGVEERVDIFAMARALATGERDTNILKQSFRPRRVWAEDERAREEASRKAIADFEELTNKLAPRVLEWSNRFEKLRARIVASADAIDKDRLALMVEMRQADNARRAITNAEMQIATNKTLDVAGRQLMRKFVSTIAPELKRRDQANKASYEQLLSKIDALKADNAEMAQLAQEYVEIPDRPRLHVARPEPETIRALRLKAEARLAAEARLPVENTPKLP